MAGATPSKKEYSSRKQMKEVAFVPGLKIFDDDGLSRFLQGRYEDGINISLLFHKCPGWAKNYNESGIFTKVTLPPIYKKGHLEKMISLAYSAPKRYQELKRRYFFDQRYSFVLRTRTRLLVGFAGTDTVFENSISLHPFYGFPVIPGSSIKGLLRNYCESSGITSDKIRTMLGDEAEAEEREEGKVVFLDAWPEKWPPGKGGVLEADIMTPHYGKYYSGRGLPSDKDTPNPISFLAVPQGIEFRFCLLPSRTCQDEENIVAEAKGYLVSALKTFGIGAKTSSSYGYFK